jgi:hypothetical protein
VADPVNPEPNAVAPFLAVISVANRRNASVVFIFDLSSAIASPTVMAESFVETSDADLTVLLAEIVELTALISFF